MFTAEMVFIVQYKLHKTDRKTSWVPMHLNFLKVLHQYFTMWFSKHWQCHCY